MCSQAGSGNKENGPSGASHYWFPTASGTSCSRARATGSASVFVKLRALAKPVAQLNIGFVAVQLILAM